MSREIKFRAWDGEFMWDDIHWLSLYKGNVSMIEGTSHGSAKGTRYDSEIEAVMQYTGLKDKNGVEIYEGDVVRIGNRRTGDSTDIAEITWYRGGFMLHLKGHFGYREIERYDNDAEKHEVIGNIHENPELLQ